MEFYSISSYFSDCVYGRGVRVAHFRRMACAMTGVMVRVCVPSMHLEKALHKATRGVDHSNTERRTSRSVVKNYC